MPRLLLLHGWILLVVARRGMLILAASCTGEISLSLSLPSLQDLRTLRVSKIPALPGLASLLLLLVVHGGCPSAASYYASPFSDVIGETKLLRAVRFFQESYVPLAFVLIPFVYKWLDARLKKYDLRQ